MKILFTADHHIKTRQKNVPIDWALNRFYMFQNSVSNLEKSHDIHIMGGDIFDRVPTLEELEIFFSWVAGFNIPTFIYSGNHESENKKRSFLARLKGVVNNINSKVHIITEISHSAELGFSDTPFYLVPYEYLKDKKTWDNLDSIPVFTHVRGEISPHVKPEIPLDWLNKFPLVFAGDLHSHKNTQNNIIYPGSPFTTSFHREVTKGSNGYLSIDTTNWSWEWNDFELPQLIRRTVSSKDDIVPTEFHHTIYELEGSLEDVSVKVDNDLLDKKIVKRSSEATLILNERMSIQDELKEYLEFVLEIDELDDIMEAFNEYCKNQQDEVG